jgi:hypothetical protein
MISDINVLFEKVVYSSEHVDSGYFNFIGIVHVFDSDNIIINNAVPFKNELPCGLTYFSVQLMQLAVGSGKTLPNSSFNCVQFALRKSVLVSMYYPHRYLGHLQVADIVEADYLIDTGDLVIVTVDVNNADLSVVMISIVRRDLQTDLLIQPDLYVHSKHT